MNRYSQHLAIGAFFLALVFCALGNELAWAQQYGASPAPAAAPAAAKKSAAPAAADAQKAAAQKQKTAAAPTPATAPGSNASVLTSTPPPPTTPRTPTPAADTSTSSADAKNSAAPARPGAGVVFGPAVDSPQNIVIESNLPPLEERINRKITLDVRDMSVVDILRFLALKGNFNVVVAGNIQGRSTLYLKSVTIKDALDLVILSNNLSYVIDKDIVRVMSDQDYQVLYGKPFNDQMAVEIIQLKYAKPNYVLSTLDNLKSALGRIIIDEDTGSVVMIDTADSIKRMKTALDEIERPLETMAYPLQFAKADVVAEKLKARVDAHSVGSITVDERSNRIIVRAFPGRRAEVEELIKDMDTPTKEVLVEARILQVVFRPQLDFGIDWNLDFRNSRDPTIKKLSFQNVQLDESNLTTSSNLFSRYMKIAFGNFNSDAFEASIRALKQVSDTKILSNPRLLVTNNEEAKIHVGDTIPYIISTTSGTGDNAITSEDVRFVDVGLKLNVTPTINEDGYVTMVLKPEISTVVGQIKSKGGGIPQVNKTLVETTVMVKDGMTIVLGGLKKDNKVKNVSGIPGLMSIPFLGKVFSATSESVETTEIVIFITPHIVTGDKDYEKYKGVIKPSKEYSGEKPATSPIPAKPTALELKT